MVEDEVLLHCLFPWLMFISVEVPLILIFVVPDTLIYVLFNLRHVTIDSRPELINNTPYRAFFNFPLSHTVIDVLNCHSSVNFTSSLNL